jgi:hypothetical protein
LARPRMGQAGDQMATVRERPPAAPGSKPAPAETTPLAHAMRHATTRAVLLAAVLVVAGILFNELITLVGAFVITVILAILFSAIAAPFEKRGVPRPIGALIAVLLILVSPSVIRSSSPS